jgi:type IV pilus assembly protein PilV
MLRSGRDIAGATMIEVLVSLLILSIGLLGMVGLQTSSLRNTQSAYFRTQATVMAEDIMERMRANPQAVRAGAYHATSGQCNNACLTVAGCSAAAMAQHDLGEWLDALAEALPMGVGRVCMDSTPDDGTATAPACDGAGNLHAVKIWWDDNRDGVANQRHSVSFRP